MEGPIRMTAPSFAAQPPPAPTPPPTETPVSASPPDPLDSARRPSRAPLVADVIAGLAIVATVALTVFGWRSVFADLGFVAPMLAASVAAVVVVTVMSRRGWSTSSTFLLTMLITLVGLAALHGGDIADAPSNLIDSWKALASTGLLMPTTAALVIPPVIVAATGSWAAAEAVIRRRLSAPGLLALLAVHAVTSAYTISQWQPTWWFAALLTGLLGLLLAISGLIRPGGASFADDQLTVGGSQVLSALAVVAALSAAAAGLMTQLGDSVEDRAFDLRSSLSRPLDISESATPLARVKAGLVSEADDTVFTVTVDGLGPDDAVGLVPVAALDRYDGTIWSTSARFEAAGSSLPSPSLSSPSNGNVDVRIELTDRYPFRFLPRVGVLRSIDTGDLAWDAVNGTVASIDPDGRSYSGTVALISEAELPDLLGDSEASIDGASDRAMLTDAQRNTLNAYLADVVDPDADPFEQLRAVQADLLSERFSYNQQSPAGHSLAALTSYLQPVDAENDAGSRVGFSEHAAASFALLARELGVPSRVVVGYLLDDPITEASPQQLVSENQIHAWPEVWVDGTGWVRLDVTNKINQSPEQPDRTPAVSAAGVEANPTDLPDVQEPVILPDEELSSTSTLPWWLLAIAFLPLLYVVTVMGAKAARRLLRKRRATDARVVGAWRETQDRFGELGLPSSPALSALDVAEELDVIDLRDVGDPVVALAPTLDTALYSPVPATEADADQAWQAAGAAIKQARKAMPMSAKVRAALDPRTLLRR